MKRRMVSILTTLALVLGLCPAWAFAAEGEPPADAVAKMEKGGTTAYLSTDELNEAFGPFSDSAGATITLLSDLTRTQPLQIWNDCTLDGGSQRHKIEYTGTGDAITIMGGTVQIRNCTVTGGINGIAVTNGTVTLTDCAVTAQGSDNSTGVQLKSNSKLIIESGTYSGKGVNAIGVEVTSGNSIIIKGGNIQGDAYGLTVHGKDVQLSGGTYTGGTAAIRATDGVTLADLLDRAGPNARYAFFQGETPIALKDAEGTPLTTTGPGTFTVGECRHPGVEIEKNEDGSHGMSCPYCGYSYKHHAAYTATASGGVITVGEECAEKSCGYKAPLGSLTVSIPELAYGELDKTIPLDTSKLENWATIGFQVDELTPSLVAEKDAEDGNPPKALSVLTGNALLNAGEHKLTVKIGISVPGEEPVIVHTVSCEIPFTVDPAELVPDYVVATNREYEKGNRTVVLQTATKDESDIAVDVEFPDGTTGTVSSENAGIYDKVTLAQDVKDSSGNYIIPAGTYPVRGRIAHETPSEDGVTILQASYEGLYEINTSAKAGTIGTYDFTNLIQGIDGAELPEAYITSSGEHCFAEVPTLSGNILTYKLKTDAKAGSTGRIGVLMTSTNYGNIEFHVTVTVTDKDVPALTVSPITATYNGEAVPDNAIQGTAKVGSIAVPGTWSFKGTAPATVADSGAKAVLFTPTDGTKYAAAESTVMVTINKATPAGTPTYTAISASGKTLADAGLTTDGCAFSTTGTVAWTLPDTTKVTANTQYEWTFTPEDTANYNTVTGSITLWPYTAPVNPGGGGGYVPSGPSTPSTSLPVNTTGQNSSTVTTTTTAAPAANTQGGTATATISTAMGNEIVKQATANKSENVVIAPSVTGSVTKAEVSIPASTVGQIGSRTNASLTVSTPVADVTIPNGGLGSLSSAGDTLTVTAERVGSSVELSVAAGGRMVQNVPGSVTLTVPSANTTPGTVAVLVHPDGTREVVRKSVADNGTVTIPLDGSAKLEIVDNSKYFADVPAMSWAADAVAFASAHELFGGTGANQFSPDVPMSRGMLAVVLHNLESNPAQALTGAFSDVDNSQWYAEGVAWAEAQGIIGGYGNGRFGPNDNITREQLAVMLWRYAGSPAATDRELHFADAYQASDWALDALRWATEKGIINGKGGGILDPTGQATRAETAQMLKNFMEKW